MPGTSARRGRTKVRGPGQKAEARARAAGGISAATLGSHAAEARWTISGSKLGRAFTSNTRAQALGLKASAARP
jgi:hypothetical protein